VRNCNGDKPLFELNRGFVTLETPLMAHHAGASNPEMANTRPSCALEFLIDLTFFQTFSSASNGTVKRMVGPVSPTTLFSPLFLSRTFFILRFSSLFFSSFVALRPSGEFLYSHSCPHAWFLQVTSQYTLLRLSLTARQYSVDRYTIITGITVFFYLEGFLF
jgi:hypothetical protein